MKTQTLIWSVLWLIGVLPMVGSVQHRALAVYQSPKDREQPDLLELRLRGNAKFNAREYFEATRIYEDGAREARARGDALSTLKFLNNLGSIYYKIYRYRSAIKAYLEARDLAIAQRDQQTLAAVYSNLSSLYYQMADMEAATESANRGLQLPAGAGAKYRTQLLIQSALIRNRQENREAALSLLREAIDASRANRDRVTEAQAWNQLGRALMDGGRIPAAESAILESYRLRKLSGDGNLHYSYESLGDLRMLQGDSRAAEGLFDRAIESASALGPAAVWSPVYKRGLAEEAQGQLHGAYGSFAAALGLLRRSRAELLPADAFRISTEVQQHAVYASFIELGSRLYRQTGQGRFAKETFAAAEQGRAASLRALWAASDQRGNLPAEYWQTLKDLQGIEAALVRNEPNTDPEAGKRARMRLTEMELNAGLDAGADSGDADLAGRLLERTKAALGPDEVYMGFHIGESESCLWAITRDGFEFRQLPPRVDYAGSAAQFARAVSTGSSEAAVLGRRLYDELFGLVSRSRIEKPVWILALEGPLFELPFAALVEGTDAGSGTPHYVIERHAIRIVPGSSVLLQPAAPDSEGPSVALGDPIYNRVDDRLPRTFLAMSGKAPMDKQPMELARLVGSAREVEKCAGIWRSHGDRAVLLEGADANKKNLFAILQQSPKVLHVAAHVLFPRQDSGPGMVALSLNSGFQIELLSSSEIASMRARLGLVVLDGCSSAHAAILPGAGLMGLTRAWLAAGARAVIVTRWAVADPDAGEFFQSFYRTYDRRGSHRGTSFGRLLQEAQVAQLREGGHHANPAYWAAYFCVERN